MKCTRLQSDYVVLSEGYGNLRFLDGNIIDGEGG